MGRELLLFAAIWFFIGAIDDIAVDIIWIAHKARGWFDRWTQRHKARPNVPQVAPLSSCIDTGGFAVFIPAWQEADVIGHMLRHCHIAWPVDDICLYVGCYPNDMETIDAVCAAAIADPRVRLVVSDNPGPTSKADCLNRLWRQLCIDEAESSTEYRAIIMHDAEDVVHAGSLRVFAHYLATHDFVQIPVRPLVNRHSRWVSGHYCDEFAEAHGKAMVVRGVVAAGIPAAGVGCAFSREAIQAVAAQNAAAGGAALPFETDSLTEDYELGLRVKDMGGSGVFVRARDAHGDLIATEEYFPDDIGAAARQKSRWMAGIALLGWDRMGWRGNVAEKWMRLRDRRAVLAALVLCCAYLSLVFLTVTAIGQWFGVYSISPLHPALSLLLLCNAVMLVWRLLFRFGFTWQQYGFVEGCRSIPRVLVANIISIMAARRALSGYIRDLKGERLRWEKTCHMIVHGPAVPIDIRKSFSP